MLDSPETQTSDLEPAPNPIPEKKSKDAEAQSQLSKGSKRRKRWTANVKDKKAAQHLAHNASQGRQQADNKAWRKANHGKKGGKGPLTAVKSAAADPSKGKGQGKPAPAVRVVPPVMSPPPMTPVIAALAALPNAAAVSINLCQASESYTNLAAWLAITCMVVTVCIFLMYIAYRSCTKKAEAGDSPVSSEALLPEDHPDRESRVQEKPKYHCHPIVYFAPFAITRSRRYHCDKNCSGLGGESDRNIHQVCAVTPCQICTDISSRSCNSSGDPIPGIFLSVPGNKTRLRVDHDFPAVFSGVLTEEPRRTEAEPTPDSPLPPLQKTLKGLPQAAAEWHEAMAEMRTGRNSRDDLPQAPAKWQAAMAEAEDIFLRRETRRRKEAMQAAQDEQSLEIYLDEAIASNP